MLALHQLDLLAPAWAGQRGKLNWTWLANAFHSAIHIGWHRLRRVDNPLMKLPAMQMLTGKTSYVQVSLHCSARW